MKTLRGSISESAKAEAPPKNPLLGHAVLAWGRACLRRRPGCCGNGMNEIEGQAALGCLAFLDLAVEAKAFLLFSFYFSVWCGVGWRRR